MNRKSLEQLQEESIQRCKDVLIALTVAGVPEDRLTCIALFAAGSTLLIRDGLSEADIRDFYGHALESALCAGRSS